MSAAEPTELAATGADPVAVGMVALILTLAGVIAVGIRRMQP